jgi:hypothetical protein
MELGAYQVPCVFRRFSGRAPSILEQYRRTGIQPAKQLGILVAVAAEMGEDQQAAQHEHDGGE